MTSSESDYHLLDIAKRVDTYGVVPFDCQSNDGKSIQVCVTYDGVHVYVARTLMQSMSYVWAQIRKLAFKRRRFLIKLYPNTSKVVLTLPLVIASPSLSLSLTYVRILDDLQNKNENVVEFTFESRDAAKNFWKLSVEHHSFFNKLDLKDQLKPRHNFLSRGSSFR